MFLKLLMKITRQTRRIGHGCIIFGAMMLTRFLISPHLKSLLWEAVLCAAIGVLLLSVFDTFFEESGDSH